MTGRAGALISFVAAVAVAACSTGAVGPSRAASIDLPADFPLGSWTVTLTEQDLRDAGISDPGLLAENTGTSTRTWAADGTWTVAQQSADPVRWPVFRGTFRVTGAHEIEEVTTFPADFEGDVVRFTWERVGPRIRIRVVNPPDPILPILTETHDWQPA